ncbi:unnamed protein product [Rotaria sordida]|uniref:PiggyBac transposable element-derived protein domain-containing protein n=1 Tax=Rotaria sordida TaxID=392033 RepID=A0A815G4L9_9BILA|nr:unnamed protein product [Rotaria sordida]
MNTIQKSNLKRIRNIILTDENEIDDNISAGQNSDSDSEYDPDAIESDDTSTNEHISEESDLSCSDIDQDDIGRDDQPETLEKDGVTWSMYPKQVQGRIPAANVMKKKPGSTTKVQTILDAFKLFFTYEILDGIVFRTNRYAEQYFNQNTRSRQASNTVSSKSRRWQPTDRVELEAFIGLLIQSGVNRSNHELLNDLWDISQIRPLYRATMSLERFKYLLQFIRFDDRQNRNKSDRLAPIRHIFEAFVKQLPQHYIPGLVVNSDLTVPDSDGNVIQF